jgi:hypothetical protein
MLAQKGYLTLGFHSVERKWLLMIFQVLATIQGESIHICFASDVKEPLTLHWGVSKLSNGEWQVILEDTSTGTKR